ncbi:unnamed protein product [Lupinus luteus]|uniref:Uncharacterized protein n=1 Tax=Lupinus luteus TaxID=3873 RepID=A0AAV1XFN5_LUPLU
MRIHGKKKFKCELFNKKSFFQASRGLTPTSGCGRCSTACEDIMYCIRECPHSLEV